MNIYKLLIALICSFELSSCTIVPSSGPSTKKIVSITRQETLKPQVELIDIDDSFYHTFLKQKSSYQSFSEFDYGISSIGSVHIGDVLDITIWEAPPAVLFGGALSSIGSGNAQQTKLPEQMVSSSGKVTVPFIGDISVAGKTPAQIQNIIQNRLQKMANQPQVIVRIAQNNVANVLVVRAGNSIRLPLTTAGERVLDAIAAVGGSTANVQDTTIQLTRGNQVKSLALEDLVANPKQNILLHKGDIITLITNPYSFTSMGAVGNTQQIGFSVKGLSLADAIGKMGGLQDRRSDARGVFVFRYAPLMELSLESQKKWLNRGFSTDSEIPIVYRLDMTDANSLFLMQKFPIKNKDILYVSNAPLVEIQKFLSFVFSPVINGINSVGNIVN